MRCTAAFGPPRSGLILPGSAAVRRTRYSACPTYGATRMRQMNELVDEIEYRSFNIDVKENMSPIGVNTPIEGVTLLSLGCTFQLGRTTRLFPPSPESLALS